LRIDPASPGSPQTFIQPAAEALTTMCMDSDGHYLVSGWSFPGTGSRPLWHVDRGSGTFTELANLSDFFQTQARYDGIAVGAEQEVYLGAEQDLIAQLLRSPSIAGDTLHALGKVEDLIYVAGVAITGAPRPREEAPAALELAPAAPNPFSAGTTLRFALPRGSYVELAIFDPLGRRVRQLVEGERPAGVHAVTWDGRAADGRRLDSGIYFVRLRACADILRGKVALMR
jgi:hypothetical protein